MKTGQFLINPASAIALAAFLAFPMHSLAQSNASPFGGRVPKPVCVYKGVMSDAEIELCTGYRVHYNYAVYSGRAIAEASAGGTVQQATYARTGMQATYLGRAPRTTRH
jgi:hypothetical protein